MYICTYCTHTDVGIYKKYTLLHVTLLMQYYSTAVLHWNYNNTLMIPPSRSFLLKRQFRVLKFSPSCVHHEYFSKRWKQSNCRLIKYCSSLLNTVNMNEVRPALRVVLPWCVSQVKHITVDECAIQTKHILYNSFCSSTDF